MSPVEQIKSRLNIVEVVSGYLKLQKAGVNYKANCPFHSEKTPSFFVSPTRESWHCFGCNKGGDIFSFVMEIEGIEFVEALKILAGRAGVELKVFDKKEESERSKLLKLMEEAKIFYEAELKKNKEVIDYLRGRGLKGQTAKTFGLGFAPSGWRNLFDYLKTKNYSESEMEKAGLIVKSGNSTYDRFRSRIMFPINNSSGQTIGFSARIFNLEASLPSGSEASSEPAKYINSPQTILYDKSRVLYAFDFAKTEIRKRDACILVEGQMDVIMSHQAGLVNTVAVSGTALTSEHLRIIKRLSDNLVFAFDKDEAGRSAAGRGIDSALAEGFEVKVAIVPSGKDPADAVKENPEEWKNAVKNSKNIIEFYLDFLENRKEIEKIVLPYVAVMPSEMERAHWVNVIANKLKINEEAVWQELKKKKNKMASTCDVDAKDIASRAICRSRLELIKERILGVAFWQKDSGDEVLKDLIENFFENCGFNKEEMADTNQKEKMIFEAEVLYCESPSLCDEFKKLVYEFEKEKVKTELLEITDKIKECEANPGKKEELENHLKEFYNLSKKLK